MSAQTRSRAARSSDPCEPDGVPTQISETSVARTASAASWVARRRPDSTASAIASGSPGSSTGA